MALVAKNPPANAGDIGDIRDMGLIPEPGRSPAGGHVTDFRSSPLVLFASCF